MTRKLRHMTRLQQAADQAESPSVVMDQAAVGFSGNSEIPETHRTD